MVFLQSLEFFLVVVSLLGLVVKVLRNVTVLGLDLDVVVDHEALFGFRVEHLGEILGFCGAEWAG